MAADRLRRSAVVIRISTPLISGVSRLAMSQREIILGETGRMRLNTETVLVVESHATQDTSASKVSCLPYHTMKVFSTGLLALGLVANALGAAVPKDDNGIVETDYDAIIVGGGPAGLSALSGLARVRRKVLLIDSGEYRNGRTRHMHDVIGFDGVTPAWYRYAAREQISFYDTVKMTNGTVKKIEAGKNNTYFEVLAKLRGRQSKVLTARKIVLATGLRDDLPDTPGLAENFANGIYWCPWCDGYEHADQGLGLIGGLQSVPGTVREILTLNEDVIAFVNGTDTAENRKITEQKNPEWETSLRLNNVTIENRIIKSITRLRNGEAENADPSLPSAPENDLFRVDFTEGPSIERNAFLTSFGASQASQVGPDMGVELWGGKLAVDDKKGLVTNIPGVYAVGDANSDNATNVPHALFSGKRSAVFLHVQLAREEEAAQLKTYKKEQKNDKRSLHETARSLWERMNGSPDDLLYAGEFDQ
ncbi:pyridine nucleotide-disulfide oxidoreductase domain-containing protein [Sarocladium implicatum]|nr:pyridine nucleotide-disulfide oxidoreductase domain-containing protein [Sarocladium implicatum]